jgi:hypothetical protein
VADVPAREPPNERKVLLDQAGSCAQVAAAVVIAQQTADGSVA